VILSIEYVYKGNDNTNDFVLKADGAAVTLSGVVKMVLDFGSEIIVDSSVTAGVFDWSGGDGGVILTLGGVTDLVVGSRYRPELIVYDATNTNGINWGKISVIVL
jgi:hypothetical protein